MYYLLQKSDGIIHRGNNTNNKLKLHFKTEALTDDICSIQCYFKELENSEKNTCVRGYF